MAVLLEDRILIKITTEEVRTSGIIVDSSNSKERPVKGEIYMVGPGTKDEKMFLKVGDQIMYGEYSGTQVEVNNETLLLMRQKDVFMILNK